MDSGRLTKVQMTCFIAPRPEEELYDIKNDPFELNNVVTDPGYAGILDSMRNQLRNIRLQSKDRLPPFRTKDEFDRESGEPNEFRIRPRPSKAEMSLYSSDHN